MAISLKLRI